MFYQVVQKQTLGEVETERSFDGKLNQEYSYQKLSKSANCFSSYSQKCRGCFLGDTVYLHNFLIEFDTTCQAITFVHM